MTAQSELSGQSGGGTRATCRATKEIRAPKGLYDVGLRIITEDAGDYGCYSALDIELTSPIYRSGDAMRIFTHAGGVRSKVTYISDAGTLYTRVGIVVSGTYANYVVNDGDDTTITPPSDDHTAIGVWSDVRGGIQVRAGNTDDPWLFEGMERNGNRVFSIEEDGSIRMGDSATHEGLVQVLGTRRTGWSVPTGTASRSAFDTATVTTEALAERFKALVEDLHATAGHGLIGT